MSRVAYCPTWTGRGSEAAWDIRGKGRRFNLSVKRIPTCPVTEEEVKREM